MFTRQSTNLAMKFIHLQIVISIHILFFFAASPVNATQLVFQDLSIKIDQASNDVKAVTAILPDIEKTFEDYPVDYFKINKQAVISLSKFKNTKLRDDALLTLWTNIMRKSLPTNENLLPVIESKWEIIQFFLTDQKLKQDKSRLIEAGNFLGSLRTKIITNFNDRAMSFSAISSDAEERARIKRAMVENEKRNLEIKMQKDIKYKDWVYSPVLISDVPFPPKKDEKFLAEFAQAARLSEDEIKKLHQRYDK